MAEGNKMLKDLYFGEPLLHLKRIQVKILKKTKLKSFTNQKTNKDGKKFNFLVIDEEGSLLEGISFAEFLYGKLKETKSYIIQKFALRKPNKKYTFMDLELVLNDETIIRKSVSEIGVIRRFMTCIKDVKENSHGSIEGIVLEVKLVGEQKHQFCTIQDEEGYQILVKYWTNKDWENVTIRDGSYIKFENITFQKYEESLCGNARMLTLVTIDDKKSLKTNEQLHQTLAKSTFNVSQILNPEDSKDSEEELEKMKICIAGDLEKKEEKLKEIEQIIHNLNKRKKKLELKIKRLRRELKSFEK